MQSEETGRDLAALDRELIVQRVHALARMRTDGNMRGLLAHVADDIVYNVRGNWMAFPYPRPIRGKKNVGEALAMIAVQFENLGSVLHDVIVDGNRVAVRRTATMRHRGTGKVGDVDIADFILFRGGLVAEFTEIADSMALAQLDDG
jgi:ketosteroid isomerase-like protein